MPKPCQQPDTGVMVIGDTRVRMTLMKNEDGKPVLLIYVKPRRRARSFASRVKDRGVDVLLIGVVTP